MTPNGPAQSVESRGLLGRVFLESRTIDTPAWAPEPERDSLEPKWRLAVWLAAIILGFLQAWASRWHLIDDGVSYLDIAQAYYRGDWHVAINAYWSPLYSWLIGFPLYVFKPSLQHELAAVQLVNFGIYLCSLASFEFCLRGLIRLLRAEKTPHSDAQPLPERCWWALGYTLFFYSALSLVGVGLVTPDMCVATLVYLASGILLRIRAGQTGWKMFAIFGAVLGTAYLTKAVMFLLAFVFLLASVFATGKSRQGLRRALFALSVFLMIGAPFIAAISKAKGRLTYGDTGRIAYAVFVTAVHWHGQWQGEGSVASPKHPVRKLRKAPAVYEFAQPVGGTYPPWYHSPYWSWSEGLEPRFSLKGHLRVLRQAVEQYFQILAQHKEFVVAFVAFCLIQGRKKSFLRRLLRQGYFWLPALAAFGLYALVHVESRFFGGFLVVVWVGLFAALWLPRTPEAKRWIWAVTLAVVLIMGVRYAKLAVYDAATIVRPPPNVNWEVAEYLRHAGVNPGDQVAVLGHPTASDYWAHLAQVKIVAEVPAEDVSGFWLAGDEVKSQIMQLFANSGAKAVVTVALPAFPPPGEWRPIGNTRFWVRLLERPQASVRFGTPLSPP